MPSPQAMFLAVLIALGVWGANAVVHEVKKVGHTVGCAFHHCEKPDPQTPPPPDQP